MADVVLVHGAGGSGWYWHRVTPLLEAAGHRVVTPDLPVDDDSAGLADYARAIAGAAEHLTGPVALVAQSLAGMVVPDVCALRPVQRVTLVAAMIPRPRETVGEWWQATGHARALREAAAVAGRDPDATDLATLMFHDVPPEVARAALSGGRRQSGAVFASAPGAPWPADVPTRVVLCRDDRFFPSAFMRRVVAERLPGVVPEEIPGGHLPALARPEALAALLQEHLER